jgi:hypothetical protein
MLGISRLQHSGLRGRRVRSARVHGRPQDAAQAQECDQLPFGEIPETTGRTYEEEIEGF